MLANYKSKEHLVCTLEPALVKCGMSRKAARWLLKNITVVKGETLRLIDFLVSNQTGSEDEYLKLSRVTVIGAELEQFVEMYQVRREWLQQMTDVFRSIERMPS